MFSVPFVLALVVGVTVSPAVNAATQLAVTDEEPAVVKIVTVEDGKAEVQVSTPTVQGGEVYVTSQDGQGATPHVETIFLNTKDGTITQDGKGEVKIVVATAQEGDVGDIDVGGPWLGIQFGPVSKPLQSQLRLEDGIGQMILNVVDDSPADAAALEQYDIIVAVDGSPISDKIGEFIEMAREFSPGQAISLEVIRGGQRLMQSLVVGTRPETMGTSKYKYEIAIEELNDGGEFFRGGLLQKNDDGSWSMKDFHADDVIDIWTSLPKASSFGADGSSMFSFYSNKDVLPPIQGKTFVWQQADAQTIRIEKSDDGEITVVRTETDDDGQETTTTKVYATEDALKAEDPEAAEFMNQTTLGGFYQLGDGTFNTLPALQPGSLDRFYMQLGKDGEPMKLDVVKLRDHVLEAMKGADVRVKLEDMTGQPKSLDFLTDLGLLHDKCKASISFKLTGDGKIQVTTRQGDEELTQVFDSAKDMKASNPELFGKYTTLHSGHQKAPSVEPK